MSEQEGASGAKAALPAQQSLSQLIARILDQLSVSAWLPAGVLVLLILLVANLRLEDGRLLDAIGHLADIDLTALVLFAVVITLTTVLTQAFEFEAIRLLEGYWGPGLLPRACAELGCRRQLGRLARLQRRQEELQRRAFPAARHRMIGPIPEPVVALIEHKFKGLPVENPDEGHAAHADSIDYMDHADPSDRRRYRALIDAQEDFPPQRLILPTRLGNTLRAYEHAVHGVSATRLENFVREVFDDLPPSLQREHDDFRARLDLYCALVLVFALSGAVSVVALWNTRSLAPISAGAAVLLAWISYRAAIASAREYGRILQAIGAVSASAPRTS